MRKESIELLRQTDEVCKLESLLIMTNNHISEDIIAIRNPHGPSGRSDRPEPSMPFEPDVHGAQFGLACEQLESDLGFYEREWELFSKIARNCIELLRHEWQKEERRRFLGILELLRKDIPIAKGRGMSEMMDARIQGGAPGSEAYLHAMKHAAEVFVSTQSELRDLMEQLRSI